MHLADGAVQRHRLKLDPQQLFALQVCERPVEDAVLGPAIHPRVDRGSVAEPPRQAPARAALLGDIQDGIEHLQVRQVDIAALHGQAGGNACVLRFGDFYPCRLTRIRPLI